MALSADELATIDTLKRRLDETYVDDKKFSDYYHCLQQVEQLGMAIPPAMRRFLVVVNWPRVVVDTPVARQQLRGMYLPGEDVANPQLLAISDASNLAAQLKMFNRDRRIYGRAFLSVGSNELDPKLPLIRAESPTEMAATIDVRHEVVTSAARFYGKDPETGQSPTNLTLYMPDYTVWASVQDGSWVEEDRDDHHLGQVPVVMHLNNRMSGGAMVGESSMVDIIGLTDSVARSLTNMQFAQEAHGIPRMWMTGVSRQDFIDENGQPIPAFKAYFDAIHTLTDTGAKIGQLMAADLKNFETAVKIYGTQAATVTGFPARYFGITAVNPSSADGIDAEEAELVQRVEAENLEVGVTLGWVGALALRFAGAQQIQGSRVGIDWFDPSTPTIAQRTDAIVKLRQTGLISQQGAWDEMGWSQTRKDREKAYLAQEAAQTLDAMKLTGDAGTTGLGA